MKAEDIKREIEIREEDIRSLRDQLAMEEKKKTKLDSLVQIPKLGVTRTNEELGRFSKEITLFSVLDILSNVITVGRYGDDIEVPVHLMDIRLSDIICFFMKRADIQRLEDLRRMISRLEEKLETCTAEEVAPLKEKISILEEEIKRLEESSQSASKEIAKSEAEEELEEGLNSDLK